MGRTIAAFLWLLALLAPAAGARAHPHVWIDASLELEFRAAQVTTIRMTWVFDDLFSDPRATRAQLDVMAANALETLKEYHYFTVIESAGQRLPVTRIENLRVTLEDQRFVYRFDIPLAAPLDPVAGDLGIVIYDPTYYVDINPPDGRTVAFTGAAPAECRVTRRDDRAATIMGGGHPIMVVVRCR